MYIPRCGRKRIGIKQSMQNWRNRSPLMQTRDARANADAVGA
jgi:hypothetical protein